MISLVAQNQHLEVFRLTLFKGTLFNTSTSPVEGECSNSLEVTTIKVPILEDSTPVPIHNMINQSIVSEDFEDEEIENIDTITDPRIINNSSFH